MPSHNTRFRDRLLDQAVAIGKFPESRREHYAAMYDRDPIGTERLIGVMAEAGFALDDLPSTADGPGRRPAHAAGARRRASAAAPASGGPAYPPHWLPDAQAKKEQLAAEQAGKVPRRRVHFASEGEG